MKREGVACSVENDGHYHHFILAQVIASREGFPAGSAVFAGLEEGDVRA